jgi:hypothetical protein
MKNLVKTTLAITIIISLVLAVASCGGGGNSPKSLAKQYVDTTGAMLKMHKDNPNLSLTDPKLVELGKKQSEIDAKIAQLSEADAQIFVDELQRLAKAAGLPGI